MASVNKTEIGKGIMMKGKDDMNSLIVALIPLLIQVESSGNVNAIGDSGQAVGCLQIHPCVVYDVNRLYPCLKYGLAIRYDKTKSIDICYRYLEHYGRAYEKKTGKFVTMEVLARIWNGGSDGWKKKSTVKYWNKVKKELEKKK
jgi:hypothetical protein